MPSIGHKSTIKSILEMWHEFLYAKCRSLNDELPEDENCATWLNEIKETSQEIRDKLQEEDKCLVDSLIEAVKCSMDSVEIHCYKSGFRDGMKLAQAMLVPENADDLICLPAPLDKLA